MRIFPSLLSTALQGLTLLTVVISCHSEPKNTSIDAVAGNEEVRQFMEAFEGRGVMTDDSQLTPASEVLSRFAFPADLELELLLAEPEVHQPVDISFDHRGRLWVVQYNQYPYPKGSKVIDIDHHIRAVFDKVPQAPPTGVKGADKITIYEDTNQDGQYDKVTDAITGLNITTGVALGRGKIWVLSPPHLLAYPDHQGDGLPDGDPEVHASGFGLEDTHAVANNLRWGPDGWLYGAQGSTTTADISTEVSKHVRFSGQAIWRYHPESRIFEIFSEGGGNTFDVEIDSKGRIYSGDNGVTRGFYYKQGGYYRKNWGKHGPLTNPYAFGFMPGMQVKGEQRRFTHAWIKYEGGQLPAAYHDQVLAINPLSNFIIASNLQMEGSSFTAIDQGKILETDDHWFRPVDIKAGPDGSVYLADWSDSRLSHIDPRDTWNKATGRIYRLSSQGTKPIPSFDLSRYSREELIQLLSHPNKWYRQQALRIFGDRKDPATWPALRKLFETGSPQEALEALWAIHLSGGFDEGIALTGLAHPDPYVRSWAIRLIGDQNDTTPVLLTAIAKLASKEKQLEVIGQIASTAKRLPVAQAQTILPKLLINKSTQTDRDNQLLIWWAVEAHAEASEFSLERLFEPAGLWKTPLVKIFILPRLVKKYMLSGGKENYKRVASLFNLAPSESSVLPLFDGLQEGLQGQNKLGELPQEVLEILDKYQAKFGEGPLALALRQEDEKAIETAAKILAESTARRREQLSYLSIFGEINAPHVVPTLLQLVVDPKHTDAVKIACLQTLQHYDLPEIGTTIVKAYPDKLRANPRVRLAALQLIASRSNWSEKFLASITESRQVKKEDIPIQIVRQFKLLPGSSLGPQLDKIWPEVKIASVDQKKKEMQRILNAMETGVGELQAGRQIYGAVCGNCHQLKGEGGALGPDLTGYDRRNLTELALNIVDPNAYIREGYVNYLFQMKDGQTIMGTIKDQTDHQYLLQLASGAELSLSTAQVQEALAQEQSLMPEHLTEPLSDQQIRDLLIYLQQ
ncbi:MAG: c-type cytochrome [Saprospiraceae bacterium]|nr:c-type cytochrome [Saprospiraceae bacterium]